MQRNNSKKSVNNNTDKKNSDKPKELQEGEIKINNTEESKELKLKDDVQK